MEIKVVDNLTEQKIGYFQSFMRESVPFILVNFSGIIWMILSLFFGPDQPGLMRVSHFLLMAQSSMLGVWGILELITMALDEKSGALHDKIANTVVVRVQ